MALLNTLNLVKGGKMKGELIPLQVLCGLQRSRTLLKIKI